MRANSGGEILTPKAGPPVCVMLAIAAVLIAPAAVGAGAADSAPEPTTLDELVAIYGTGDVAADILVDVDTSSSMIEDGAPPPWTSVVQGYNALIDSTGPSDQLGLITFDSAAALRLDFLPMDSEAAKATARGQLPQVPTGTATNIGAGLEAAVDRLSRGGAAQIQTLIFMTDGKHNSPADSKYPTTTGPAWDELKRQGQELTASRQGRLSVFGWGAGGSSNTDVALVQQVFPDAQILAIPTEQIPGFMASLATEVERERVRPGVQADLDDPVHAEVALNPRLQGEMQGILTLTNTSTGIPVMVDYEGLSVTEDGAEVRVESSPQQYALAPGETVEVPFAVFPEDTDRGFIVIGPRVDERFWDVQVLGSSSISESMSALLISEQLATPDQATQDFSQPEKIVVSVTTGITLLRLLIIIGLIALALVIAAAFVKWFFIPPPLRGAIADEQGKRLMELSGKKVKLPNAQVGRPESPDAVELFTRPRSGKAVYMRRVAGLPEWNTMPMTPSAQKLLPLDEITLDGKRYTYVDATSRSG